MGNFPDSWNEYVERQRRAKIQEAKARRKIKNYDWKPAPPKEPLFCEDCKRSFLELMKEERGWHPLLDVCHTCYLVRRRAQWAVAQARVRDFARTVSVELGNRLHYFNERRVCPYCVVVDEGNLRITNFCHGCSLFVESLSAVANWVIKGRPQPPTSALGDPEGYERYRKALGEWAEKDLRRVKEADLAYNWILGDWRKAISKNLLKAKRARYLARLAKLAPK